MTRETVVEIRGMTIRYRKREVFRDLSCRLGGGEVLGVVGPNGAGKTTLLRALVGLVRPDAGEIRIDGHPPRRSIRVIPTAYFGGEATLPGDVRAMHWGRLSGQAISADRRRIRVLSRGARQLLGLRTVLARSGLRLVVLDEPWEGLDPDASRWLTAAVEARRADRASVVVSSHRLHDLAGVCDTYLFLIDRRATILDAREISQAGPVTGVLLTEVFDRLKGGAGCAAP